MKNKTTALLALGVLHLIFSIVLVSVGYIELYNDEIILIGFITTPLALSILNLLIIIFSSVIKKNTTNQSLTENILLIIINIIYLVFVIKGAYFLYYDFELLVIVTQIPMIIVSGISLFYYGYSLENQIRTYISKNSDISD